VARRQKLEDALAALESVRGAPRSAESLAALRAALAGGNPFPAAKAAKLAGQLELAELGPDLAAAFDRMLAGNEADAGCTAKADIAEALYKLGHDDAAVFLRGIRHVQMEPVFGGRVDTAVDLRGACAFGLVRIGYRDVLVELADLLADPEAPVRISAARALAYRGGKDAVPLLRLRILTGDKPEVMGECLSALLRIAGPGALPFAARFLEHRDHEVAEAAALAIGASRLEEAFADLREWVERVVTPVLRRAGLVAIATLRRDAALDYLFALVEEAPPVTAAQAVDALGLYKGEQAIEERLRRAAAGRRERPVRDALQRALGDAPHT
jgi:HEAT repeat protein